jgi:ubiquinone/menaquinone biosynthesis C-methylase UbiE
MHRAVGLDSSLAMLSHAYRSPHASYVGGRAEELPFRTDSFDLLTVSLAFHWLDRRLFLTEALRVLGCTGLLVVYDNFFAGRTGDDEDEGLGQWMRDIYWRRYPYPPRSTVDFAPEESVDPGFQCETRNEYQNIVEFSRERLVDYLVTQTNVIAAVEEGEECIDDVRGWLLRELASFFEGRESRRFIFECPIWILRPKE